MTWTADPFDPTAGLDVGSHNSQDEFYGYGEGLMNPDQIVIDMKERIHMVQADATPFFSWTSAMRKVPCHNTSFSWIEDEIFGHRDFRANLRRKPDGDGGYVYVLEVPQGGDWQAMEAVAQADVWDATRPTIFVQMDTVIEGTSYSFSPLIMGLAEGRKNRPYVTDSDNTIQLMNELILADATDGHVVMGGGASLARKEVAAAGDGDLDPDNYTAEWIADAAKGDDFVAVFCHTVTPNEALGGFAQGSGLPSASRKRSRSFHNYVQIFKTSLTIANTLKHIRLYGGPQLARERIRKAVQHKVDIEMAILFQGGGVEGIHWGELPAEGSENPLTRFKGLGIGAAVTDATRVGSIYSKNADLDAGYRLNPATAGIPEINALTNRLFDDVVDDPSSTKICFAGNKWFLALSQMAMNSDGAAGNPFFGWRAQSGNRLGMRINELETPSGILRFVRMPHFRGRYEDYGLVVDLKNIEVKPLQGRDTKMFADAGEKYIDGQLDYFLTELGMEVRHESTHAILKLV